MSMKQGVATLFQLQQLDLDLDRLTSEQQAIASSLQGHTKLNRLRTEYSISQQQLQSGIQAQKEAEWALEDANQRLAAQEQRLYGGTVSNPKELHALQQEVQRLRAQQSRQEDKVLQVIDAAESLQEMVKQKAEALRAAEQSWKEESAALVTRLDQLEARRKELQAKRSQAALDVAADLLTRYEAMRPSKQGRAVSRVEQNACQWCRVLLTSSEMQRVRIGVEVQTCSNCGRILYYDR
jgi:predicted  nucleic acid-binding Zn-ribbon protein